MGRWAGSVAYDDIAVIVPAAPDTAAPIITFIGNAGTYAVDETILITCEATDAQSGIATTSCPTVASGPAVDFVSSTNPTVTTITASATDNAGNTAFASSVFTVTVTADGICRLAASLSNADTLCAQLRSIAAAPEGMAKAGRIGGFDSFLEAQSGKSIEASFECY